MSLVLFSSLNGTIIIKILSRINKSYISLSILQCFGKHRLDIPNTDVCSIWWKWRNERGGSKLGCQQNINTQEANPTKLWSFLWQLKHSSSKKTLQVLRIWNFAQWTVCTVVRFARDHTLSKTHSEQIQSMGTHNVNRFFFAISLRRGKGSSRFTYVTRAVVTYFCEIFVWDFDHWSRISEVSLAPLGGSSWDRSIRPRFRFAPTGHSGAETYVPVERKREKKINKTLGGTGVRLQDGWHRKE